MLEDLSEAELLTRLEKALAWIPAQRRAIFLAVRLDGADYAELGAGMELTVREVEHEVAAALLQIDEVLCGRPPRPRWRRLLDRLIGGARL